MPEVSVYDGGHTAFHDHWIRVRRETPSLEQSQRLRAWREVSGNLRNRNLGLAYISFGSKSGDRNLMTTGFKLLGSQPADVAVETARGLILLRMNKAVEAVHSLRRAVNENPRDSTARYNLAVALLAAGDRSAAMRNVEEAIALEPLLEEAYVLAAEIEPHRSGEWKQRYRMLAPQRFLR
jgi:predicted Zn-dependent protease